MGSTTNCNIRCAVCGLDLELSATPATAFETGTCSATCAELLDEQLELESATSAYRALDTSPDARAWVAAEV